MTMTLQNVKGPAEAATSPDRGSIRKTPSKDFEMNSAEHNTGPAIAPALSRRGFLGAAAVASLPVTAAAATATAPADVSIDAFLGKALPSERVRYHANALAEAMAEMHPVQSGWRIQIDHECRFAMIAGCRTVGKVFAVVDDGSPLLAGDVTGTAAYADWEASR